MTPARCGRHVRDGGEDLRPVAAHLLVAGESARRMCGSLVRVVRREARHDRLEVVPVGRLVQPGEKGRGSLVVASLIAATSMLHFVLVD